ncbi:hypothetical protein B0H13DRAFT_2132258 [Mycena leptocephala]|nr:hypothetical protein B0H13DRAFT_2132258 [Mycena leptocephala]
MGKRSRHVDLGPDPDPAGASTQAPAATGRIMREKTKIQEDGTVYQERSMLKVAASDEAPELPPARRIRIQDEPVYDTFSAGEDDDGTMRESDDPNRQWAEDHLDMYLEEVLRLEGRGDHIECDTCARCSVGNADHRCVDCLGGGELLCSSCIVAGHRQLPFHRIQRWTNLSFERVSLKTLGLRIQLGHWRRNDSCPVPTPCAGDDFVIVDNSGVHEVGLDFCGCAATFAVLRRFQLLSFESKCGAYEFYQSLARESDNIQYKKSKNRYAEFLRMTKQWRHIRMLKRFARGHDPLGITNTKEGECALLCPACPHPGKNLPLGWEDVPAGKKFLYALFLGIDANFRLKRKDVSSEAKDPGLNKGWAFYCEVEKYMKHVAANWNQKQERSHCVAHDAVDKPDREARGTASSGIGTVDCARHNMKRPNSIADLQLGERYLNMDYIFFKSIAGSELVRFFVSYDIACQWHINILVRMLGYENAELTIDGQGKFLTFLVPKFHLPAHIEACNLKYSFNLTPDVGQTDGEAPERGWSDANPLARSTKEMGPGSRRDALDDHFNDGIIRRSSGHTLRRKMVNAVPEMVRTRLALSDQEELLEVETVEEWTAMAELWEKDVDAKNPFETHRKDTHLAKVRAELATEAAKREVEGREDAGDVKDDMHITELIAMGLQLEEQQRTLGFDAAAMGLHPTDEQRRAMIERTSKLRRKIVSWIDVQTKFFPGLATVRELEDAARARAARSQAVPGIKVSDIGLWLPSTIAAAPPRSDVLCKDDICDHEYRMRVGQAHEALDEVRRLLLVRTHQYKLKDVHARGVRANTRSNEKIAALNDRVKRAAASYRAARKALVALGRTLKRDEWQVQLRELKEDDVRGLPRARFSDPDRKKKQKEATRREAKKAKLDAERPPSWIWISEGISGDPGDRQAMNEAVRIEWAKARARRMRWREEVDLLEEEMRRVLQFLRWRSDWWMDQVGRRGLAEGAQLEGETAYAVRQAGVQMKLHSLFTRDWEGLPALVEKGRAGLLDEDTGSAEDGDADDVSGEELEAISSLPQRPLRSTYVDEVLAYT